MFWTRVLIYVGIVLGVWVIVHLLRLRLHRVYRLFCVFLIFEVLSRAIVSLNGLLHFSADYRILWLAVAAPGWILETWVVYALLEAVLANLPGVLSLSLFLLRVSFVVAGVAAIGVVLHLAQSEPASLGRLARAALLGIQVERAVGVLALLVLLGISLFVLWFPVQMPRNLLAFTAGLTVYFLFRTAAVLASSFLQPGAVDVLREVTLVVLPACYVYWALSISAKGELMRVRVGHSWSTPANRQSVLNELEKMNAALLRSVKNYPLQGNTKISS
jgi:hypothetical protein